MYKSVRTPLLEISDTVHIQFHGSSVVHTRRTKKGALPVVEAMADALRQCEATLARYQAQNASCRNQLYADLERARPPHHHPLALLLAGAVLGALCVVAWQMLRIQ